MPVYIRKGPLEIPPGSERDWATEEQNEDSFIKDPDQALDLLPQPFRMIDKVVNHLIYQALEIISINEHKREQDKLKRKTEVFTPIAEIQVTKRVNCLAAMESGTYLFVGHSEGLAVYSFPDCHWICGWEDTKIEICSLSICHVKNQLYMLATVDDMGIARLLYFSEDRLNLLKVINEPEDVSKRTICVTLKVSAGGDYAGILLEGSEECWLEVYRLPKDSWLKEVEHAQTVLLSSISLPATQTAPSETLQTEAEIKLAPPVLLMKIKPPNPVTGSTFKCAQEAVQKYEHNTVFGIGQNHIISGNQWEEQEAIFTNSFQKYLSFENANTSKSEPARHAEFHFIQPERILQADTESNHTAIPKAISVHWRGNHNLLMYLLVRPPKDKPDADPKPDTVWPCAAAITCSAISSCFSYLAVSLADGTFTIWDIKYSGFPLAVVALPEERSIGGLQFLDYPAVNADPLPNGIPATPRVKLLVWCTDNSLYLATASGGKETSLAILRESSGNSDEHISTVAPVPCLPNAVLLFFRNGLVELMDVLTQETVCQFGLPLNHQLSYPWQPVYALDPKQYCLFLKGQEKVTVSDILANRNEACSLFAFNLNCAPLVDAFIKKHQSVAPAKHIIQWDKNHLQLFQRRLQTYPERSKHISETWDFLRKQASSLIQQDKRIR
ncbi:WD repeat-containing protein 93 [Xenopus laevis]|uniref:WD repeat-containing protein 93 n=2 Tax=Xenopus laevis TaxID=8355 RepID=A0A1L8H0V8_XENLA|nr:WD repeat-containing protein 93 [Xenopus laevis]OCT89727.1 hypothetical protein XELAEV_18018346mg [Xenopus laevis]